ncbi:MAG: hypothetical protein M3041_19970 [Acidobacteriota bacterium]|nr:hypothetical protein [Acidobacteriota bacterium]
MIRVTIARQRTMRIARLLSTEVINMKRTITALLIALSLSTAACTTAVVVRPPRVAAVWVPAHYERIGFHRVFIAGHWRY